VGFLGVEAFAAVAAEHVEVVAIFEAKHQQASGLAK
jgi:hypothetical protein